MKLLLIVSNASLGGGLFFTPAFLWTDVALFLSPLWVFYLSVSKRTSPDGEFSPCGAFSWYPRAPGLDPICLICIVPAYQFFPYRFALLTLLQHDDPECLATGVLRRGLSTHSNSIVVSTCSIFHVIPLAGFCNYAFQCLLTSQV